MSVTPPMTLMDFFRKSAGVWFTKRNVHHFDCVANESGDSNLFITVIASSHTKVHEICALQNIDPNLAVGGASFTWQDNLDDVTPNEDYAAILVDVPDDATGRTGRILRNKGYVERIPVVSRYWFGTDGILTIDTEYDNNQGQERCWFITDDFRVRVSNVRMMGGVNLVTYCSERRCLTNDDLAKLVERHQAIAG